MTVSIPVELSVLNVHTSHSSTLFQPPFVTKTCSFTLGAIIALLAAFYKADLEDKGWAKKMSEWEHTNDVIMYLSRDTHPTKGITFKLTQEWISILRDSIDNRTLRTQNMRVLQGIVNNRSSDANEKAIELGRGPYNTTCRPVTPTRSLSHP